MTTYVYFLLPSASHPVIGVPVVRLKVCERLSSTSSVEVWVSTMSLRVQWMFFGLAHRTVGRVARTNVVEVMFRVMLMLLSELLMLGGQKILRICCIPTARGVTPPPSACTGTEQGRAHCCCCCCFCYCCCCCPHIILPLVLNHKNKFQQSWRGRKHQETTIPHASC